MLKHYPLGQIPNRTSPAAFRRLCVETPDQYFRSGNEIQPPSGGCVLKQQKRQKHRKLYWPAAFRRLCVETGNRFRIQCTRSPAAFRRLCVETDWGSISSQAISQPPSGGCVLKLFRGKYDCCRCSSRLQAAVC